MILLGLQYILNVGIVLIADLFEGPHLFFRWIIWLMMLSFALLLVLRPIIPTKVRPMRLFSDPLGDIFFRKFLEQVFSLVFKIIAVRIWMFKLMFLRLSELEAVVLIEGNIIELSLFCHS